MQCSACAHATSRGQKRSFGFQGSYNLAVIIFFASSVQLLCNHLGHRDKLAFISLLAQASSTTELERLVLLITI